MLGAGGKRVLLTVHIILNAIWMGGLAVLLLIMLVQKEAGTGEELAAISRMLFLINDVVVMNTGFLVIATGLLFSLFTRWGFFDFPWVILKWAGLVVIFVGVTFFLAPAINGMAALSDLDGLAAITNPEYDGYRTSALRSLVFLLGLLVVLVVLSVFKPWGPRRKPFKVSRRIVLASGLTFGALALGGGILQFFMLQTYRAVPVQDVDLSGVRDGAYPGEAHLGVPYTVEVSVEDHRIIAVTVQGEAPNQYARLATGVTGRIVREQTPRVRAVTGATTSSKGLMKATENALRHGHQMP